MYMGCHFTENEMLQLVEIYKDYDCLWDATHPLYKDNQARRNAYKEILRKLNIPKLTVKDIPKKIKNLRSSYYQEIKRIRSSVRSGASGDSLYKPKVSWFAMADGFLRAVRNEREPFSKRSIKGNKLAKVNDNTQDQNQVDRIDKITERMTPLIKKEEDEFDSFGIYIATVLRSMPQEFSIIAKTELQKTMSEIQLRIIRQVNAYRSTESPCYSASTTSDNDNHNSGCLTPTSDSFASNIKIEYDS